MSSDEHVKGEGFELLDEGKPDEPEAKPPEGAGAEGSEQAPLDVYTVLRVSIAQLSAVAWQMMGLQPDPFTNSIRKDLGQARVAIDAAAALIGQLSQHLRGQEERDYQSLLTDLRLNYVRQSGEAAPES